jgi:anti-anti-sigma regulatory factor
MLKIEATRETETILEVALAGSIEGEYLPELEELVRRAARDRRRLSFDLSQVRMVDRETVAFFASGNGRRARLTGCPTYLRRWLESESRHHL